MFSAADAAMYTRVHLLPTQPTSAVDNAVYVYKMAEADDRFIHSSRTLSIIFVIRKASEESLQGYSLWYSSSVFSFDKLMMRY